MSGSRLVLVADEALVAALVEGRTIGVLPGACAHCGRPRNACPAWVHAANVHPRPGSHKGWHWNA